MLKASRLYEWPTMNYMPAQHLPKKDFGILQLNYNDLFKHILFASSLLETQELPLQQNITVNLG